MAQVQLPAIPWSHERSDFGSVWRWETPHFVITVNGNDRSCYYTIADKIKTPDSPKPIADGQAATFEQAERLIRETIGKAYPAKLGYQRIAGPLATTFTIGTGARVDLGPYAGHDVVVTVANGNDGDSTYAGLATVLHYHLYITQDGKNIKVAPSHILAIRRGALKPGEVKTTPATAPATSTAKPAPTAVPTAVPTVVPASVAPAQTPKATPPGAATPNGTGPRRPTPKATPITPATAPQDTNTVKPVDAPTVPEPTPTEPPTATPNTESAPTGYPRRVMIGIVTGKCNGRPGIVKNTIEHTSEPCPVHETPKR
jgi:hypothetical protein